MKYPAKQYFTISTNPTIVTVVKNDNNETITKGQIKKIVKEKRCSYSGYLNRETDNFKTQ